MRHKLAAAIFAALVTSLAHAETTAALATYDELDRILVSATLSPAAVRNIAAETSVLLRRDIERRLAQDIRDLVRYEPGVSAGGGGRFGLTGFTIRGLGGNRVRIEVDGVPAPDAFSIGSFSSAGRDVVDVATLKRVEIIRGAASSLHGSDALGGVVSFVTKDPIDYLAGDGAHGEVRMNYDSADRQHATGATAALRSGAHGLVLDAVYRDGHALSNRGDVDSADATRTRPDPQNTHSTAVLAKYVYAPDAGRTDRVTFDGERVGVRTNVLDQLGARNVFGNIVLTSRLDGDDARERVRLGYAQELQLNADFADRVDWRVYVQRGETTQDSYENRATLADGVPTKPVFRYRHFDFDQFVQGAEVTAFRDVTTGAATHRLAYGLDISRTRTREQRDGFQRDATTGTITNVVSPDTFPVRDFPLTHTTTFAAFAQDQISFGTVELVPGVRMDRYRLSPENDPTFAEDNPGVAPAQLSDMHASPKLGLLWHATDALTVFAQYAEGFRTAPYSDVNLGFTNLQQGYTAKSNPDLKPETSRSIEFGLRSEGTLGYFSVGAYYNRYRDFIESQHFVGIDEETGLMVFQSVNLGRVDIRGVEARAALRFGAFAPALDGLELRASAATARGDDETASQPLDSIEPSKAVIGLAYERERWSIEALGTFVRAKRRLADNSSAFRAPDWSSFDVYANFTPLQSLEFYFAATNLTNRRYWNWTEIAGLAYQPAIFDRYSAPGRAVSVGFKFSFD